MNADYGLMALFSVQVLVAIGATSLFVRLQINIQRIKDAEITYKHQSESQKEKIEGFEKKWERHKEYIKSELGKKLDYENALDKLHTEIKRLSSRLSYYAKKIPEEKLEEQPTKQPVMYTPGEDSQPAVSPNGKPMPGFGGR